MLTGLMLASESSDSRNFVRFRYMQMCSADYIAISDPRRFCLQREMYAKVSGTEDVEILVDDDTDWGDGLEMVTIAATNMPPTKLMQAVAAHLAAFKIKINRAHVDVVLSPDAELGDNIVRALPAILVFPKHRPSSVPLHP